MAFDAAQTNVGSRSTPSRQWEHDFAGLRVSCPTAREFLEVVASRLRLGIPFSVTFLNPDYARQALHDPNLRESINGFDAVLVDGRGVSLLTPLFGFRVPERLDTDSILPRLLDVAEDAGAGVFLFGCAPGMADAAAATILAARPKLRIAGTEHGYWDVLRGHPGHLDARDTDRIVAQMNRVNADMVLVSLPTPMQQEWVAANRDKIHASLVMTSGSLLDHVADNRDWPRSWYPNWANRLGLNWLSRLVREPRRLWRRYTIEMIDFAWLVLRARARR